MEAERERHRPWIATSVDRRGLKPWNVLTDGRSEFVVARDDAIDLIEWGMARFDHVTGRLHPFGGHSVEESRKAVSRGV